MYGMGYPVMYHAAAGRYALWFLIVLAFAKIAATSLTLGIGGSGGVFAPSLFIGVSSGMAFGGVVHHLFGPGAGDPALYAVVTMGAVFASAACPTSRSPTPCARCGRLRPPRPEITLTAGDRVSLLTAAPGGPERGQPGGSGTCPGQ
jgi:voltage-gated chloride channel